MILYNNECGLFQEVLNNCYDIDIVITSPPYNIGHDYEDYHDNLPRSKYLKILEDMLCGAFKVLKQDGLLVIDISEEIYWDSETWNSVEYIKTLCISLKFYLVAEYIYDAQSPVIPESETRGHSIKQHILVFCKSKENISLFLPKSSPFNNTYKFGMFLRNEAFWPPDLIDDFISVFDLHNKTILDPFMGSALIGLRASRNGCKFIGYEISKKLCDEAIFRQNFEFGAEWDSVKQNIDKEFNHWKEQNFFYIGFAIKDTFSNIFKIISDKYFGSDDIVEERKNRFQNALKHLKKKGTDSLNQILLRRVAKTKNNSHSIILVIENGEYIVYTGNKNYTKSKFNKKFELNNKEIVALDIHFDLLSYEKKGTYFAFFPITTISFFSTSVIAYLTVCGDEFSYKTIHSIRNKLTKQFLHSGYEIIERRLNSTYQKQRDFARLSAAAAILSRNMSHNIGSHVIPRSGIIDIYKRIKDLHPQEVPCPAGDDLLDIVGSMKNRVDDYIRQKSDFLAEVTTEPAGSAFTAFLYRDVLLPFITNTVLMDCLAANESFRYTDLNQALLNLRLFVLNTDKQNKYEEIFGNISCTDKESKFEFMPPYMMRDPIKGFKYKCAPKIINSNKDIAVAFPGGTGQFALYGILENIIRNAAKHNSNIKDKVQPKLTINLYIEDKKDTDYYSLFISDNVSAYTPHVDSFLNKDLIDSSGKVRQEAWGTAEIMICANLLAGSTSFTNQDNVVKLHKKIPFINKDSCESMVYEIKLLKPKQAIFIGKTIYDRLNYNDYQQEWKQSGIVAIYPDEYTNEKKNDASLSCFQFAVIEQDAYSLLAEKRNLFPFRVIRINKEIEGISVDSKTGDILIDELFQEEDNFTPCNSEHLMNRLWSIWCCRWLNNHKNENINELPAGVVSIYLDNIEDLDFSKDWQKAQKNVNRFAMQNLQNRSAVYLDASWGEKSKPVEISTHGNCRNVLFDRHGGAIKGREIDKKDSYIAFDKNNEDFIKIFHPRFPSEDIISDPPWSFPYELFEAGMLRVLILDERICERSMSEISTDTFTLAKAKDILLEHQNAIPRMWHIAFKANVLIATHFIFPGVEWDTSLGTDKFEPQDIKNGEIYRSYQNIFSQYKNEDKDGKFYSCPTLIVDAREDFDLHINRIVPDETDESIELFDKNIDVIIIHQGLLDTMKSNLAKNKYMSVMEKIRNKCRWVIIESGRGIPPEVQKNDDKFMPFSAIDRCFGADRIAKLTLCQRIMTQTRVKEKLL